MDFNSDLVRQSIDLFVVLKRTTFMSDGCCANWISYQPFFEEFSKANQNGCVTKEISIAIMAKCCERLCKDKEYRHGVPGANSMIRGFHKAAESEEKKGAWLTK